jgi:carboxylesterase type B
MLIYSCFVAAAGLTSVIAQSSTTVVIEPGAINGANCVNLAVNPFLSIPYAQPPIGDLRFAPPQAYEGPYPGGSLEATARAPSCIQFGTNFVATGPQSEDWQVCQPFGF